MIFKLNLNDSASVYRQICDQVKYAVATGALASGDRLPTIRDVATQTRVNRNTVAKAYTELEREGVILSRQGQGSFVAEGATPIRKREIRNLLEGMARDLFVQAFHLQVSREELSEMLDRVGEEFSDSVEEEASE